MNIIEKDILTFLQDQPAPVGKREIARAFGIKGDDRIELKRLIKYMAKSGMIEKGPGQAISLPDALPAVTIIEVTKIDHDGEMEAKPIDWVDPDKKPPEIAIQPGPKTSDLVVGDRALAKLKKINDKFYEAIPLRVLKHVAGKALGLVVKGKRGFVLEPTNKKQKFSFAIPQEDLKGAKEGDLVLAEIMPSRRAGMKQVRVTQVIGTADDPKAISLICIHEHGIRDIWPAELEEETRDLQVPDLKKREDLRDIPLVTIDGADARDFDDAVFAEKEADGSWHIIVAIADVSYYVRPGSALDKEAWARGNSTYFPDRVVPMLPEVLSNGLCSLVPHENRACMAFHMWIDETGRLIKHKIVRGLMRSAERLIYEQVQAARDGQTDDKTAPLMDKVINPLYEAWKVLDTERGERGALDLDIPERKVVIDDNNQMVGVEPRERIDAHRLIEEFMILANVAAAETLEQKNAPCMYRVHDRPLPEKVDSLRESLEPFGYRLAKGQVIKPHMFNSILTKAKGRSESHLISDLLLRTQARAVYSPENLGHFGLALRKYAHFTSPIRRYADLVVHRSLIRAYDLGEGGLSEGEAVGMGETADHISTTERTSSTAERDAVDRFTAQYMSEKVGAEFTGRINGVTRFGLFVTLHDSGADGLIPIRTLPDDYYIHDERLHALIGRKSRRVYQMSATVTIRIAEADPLTGSMVFEMVGKDSAVIPGFDMDKALASAHKHQKRAGGKPPPKDKSGKKGDKRKKRTTPKHKKKKQK